MPKKFLFLPQLGKLNHYQKEQLALDFAFSIHTEIGMKTRGARVNGKLVPLSRALKSGEHVEVITSENIKPTANWLDFVKTSRAKAKIKSSLNEAKKRIAEDGRETLRRKLKQLKITLNDKTTTHMLEVFQLRYQSGLVLSGWVGHHQQQTTERVFIGFQQHISQFFQKKNQKTKSCFHQ